MAANRWTIEVSEVWEQYFDDVVNEVSTASVVARNVYCGI